MQTFIDDKMNRLQKELKQLNEAADTGDAPKTKVHAEELIKKAARLGYRSAYLHWKLAVAYDMLEETEAALKEITMASALDPFDHNIERSFEIIVWKLRDGLHTDAYADEEGAIPRIYEKLSKLGCADVSSHLAMVRYLAVTKTPEVAMEFVDSILKLHPYAVDAWRHKGGLAEAMGNKEVAADCRAQVTALEGMLPNGDGAVA